MQRLTAELERTQHLLEEAHRTHPVDEDSFRQECKEEPLLEDTHWSDNNMEAVAPGAYLEASMNGPKGKKNAFITEHSDSPSK